MLSLTFLERTFACVQNPQLTSGSTRGMTGCPVSVPDHLRQNGSWVEAVSGVGTGRVVRSSLDTVLAIGCLSWDRIDNSFLYVTFYLTL